MRRSLSFSRRQSAKADAPGGETVITATPNRPALLRTLSFGRSKEHELPRHWRCVQDADGAVCYVHTVTQQRSYERPRPLPAGWRAARDSETGDVYYWHKHTREVCWQQPNTPAPAADPNINGPLTSTSHVGATAAVAAEASATCGNEGDAPLPPARKTAVSRKMSFGRKKRDSAGARAAGAAPSADAASAPAAAPVMRFGRRADLNIADFMFSKRRSEALVKLPGEVDGQQFIIEECEDCDIYVLDWSAQVTIDVCHRCRIFLGPVEASVFIRDSTDISCVIACQQLRTRGVQNLTALLHTVSQPSVEATNGASFGCFSFFYPELQTQLEKAHLSPFNNRWNEPYNFTPKVGTIQLLRADMPYTDLLLPLSQICPQLLSVEDEPGVPSLSPVPRTLGLHAVSAGEERCFVLVLPRCAPNALRWLRTIVSAEASGAYDDNACVLLRSKEYTKVPQEFVERLVAQSAKGRKLVDHASKGSLVGLLFAASGCINELGRRTAAWNTESGLSGAAAYSTATISECAHMCQVFFEHKDSGTAMS